MGFFTWIAGKLAGNVVGNAVNNAAGKAAELGKAGIGIVGKAFEDTGDMKSARVFAAPSEHGNGFLRQLLDAINMSIRPALAVFVMYLIFAYLMWDQKWDTTDIDQDVKTWFEWVMAFYFGQRAAVHDLPRMIRNFRKAFGKG